MNADRLLMVAFLLCLTAGVCVKPNEGEEEVPILESVNISNSPDYPSEEPSCAVDSRGTVHVVWTEETPPLDEKIYYACLPADGIWSAPIDLTPEHGANRFPALAVGPGDRLHLVWQCLIGGWWRILYMSRDPDGSWSVPETLPGSGRDDNVVPLLAVKSDGTVCVVWEFNGYYSLLRYAERSPEGRWSTPVVLSTTPFAMYSQIAVDPADNVHLVYRWLSPDYGRSVIYYIMKSADGNWSQPMVISNDTVLLNNHPSFPWLAVDRKGNLHVLWKNDIRPFLKHRLRRADGTWSEPVQLCTLRWGGYVSSGVIGPADEFYIPGCDTFVKDSTGVFHHGLFFAVAPPGGDPNDTIRVGVVRKYVPSRKAIACDSTGKIHLVWSGSSDCDGEIHWFAYKPQWHGVKRGFK